MGKIIGMIALAGTVFGAFVLFGDVRPDPVARVANLGVRAANAGEVKQPADQYSDCSDQSVCLPDTMSVSGIGRR